MRHVPLLLAALSAACASADSQPLTKEVEEPGDVAVASNPDQALDHLLADFFSAADYSVTFGPNVKYPAAPARSVGFRLAPWIPLTFHFDYDTEVVSGGLSFR